MDIQRCSELMVLLFFEAAMRGLLSGKKEETGGGISGDTWTFSRTAVAVVAQSVLLAGVVGGELELRWSSSTWFISFFRQHFYVKLRI